MKYPGVRRDEAFQETLHATPIKDPYRWLEDPHSAETKEFVKAQNLLSSEYLATFKGKEALKQKLTEAYDFEKFGCPFKRGETYYYFHNSGLQAQSILYSAPTDSPNVSAAKVFFDPNKLSEDGTASLSTFSFSESGKLFAYGVSVSGSDWTTIKLISVGDLSDHSDIVEWVKFSGITWTHDDKGFFYLRYPKPTVSDAGTETDINTCPTLCYHRVGQKQTEDDSIYHDAANPTHMFGTVVSDDGKYLIMTISDSCDPINKLYIMDLGSSSRAFTKVVDEFKAEYSYVANVGSKFVFKTNLKSPRYKLVQYDLSQPEKGFQDFIGETENVLQEAHNVAVDKLVLVYMQDCKNTFSIYDLSGKKLKDLNVEIGSLESLTGRKQDTTIYFKMSSFVNPGLIYKYQFSNDSLSVHYVTKLNLKDFKIDDYKQEQVFYTSSDGKKVPMFVVSNKTSPKKHRPVYLYGYGGFNISITPMFSPQWAVFMMAFDGILAIPNIRGGGEYGDEWHKAGCLKNKQQCFDDFQYAAKHLIKSDLTTANLIAINGGSNGGLLVAACTNQAPELYGCAIAEVGVLDMFRFHKFTIGHAWRSDYGDPDVKEDFEYLATYSPYHTVSKEKTYPSVLLLTSDHDDRVVPLHSFKYIAAIQHARPDNPNPLLIRIDTKSGHGKGKPTSKRIEEAADRLSFISLSCKVDMK